MKVKMVICPACGKEIAANAKTCPSCGAKIKKPFYKKWWFILIVVIVLLAAIGSTGDSEPSGTNNDAEGNEEVIIEYTACTTDELKSALESNALKAEETYTDLYVEVTGKLGVIDSDGKYISLEPMNDMFALTNVQCNVKTDEQKERIMDMEIGDKVTVRGKITQVGEILGYTMNIDEIL